MKNRLASFLEIDFQNWLRRFPTWIELAILLYDKDIMILNIPIVVIPFAANVEHKGTIYSDFQT
ncbi:MAG: hypothetical protein WBZ36_21230 [Candidatus Nitrosopolaris sp.]